MIWHRMLVLSLLEEASSGGKKYELKEIESYLSFKRL